MEIMKLIPSGKDYLWGGTRLKDEYGKKIDMNPLAESWECSVHPDGPCYVANGKYKGNVYELNIRKSYDDVSFLKRFSWKKSALKLREMINSL